MILLTYKVKDRLAVNLFFISQYAVKTVLGINRRNMAYYKVQTRVNISTVYTYRYSVSGGFQRQQQFGIRSCYIVHFYQIRSGYNSLQLGHTHPAQFLQLFLTHFTRIPLLYINLGDMERRKFGSGIYD